MNNESESSDESEDELSNHPTVSITTADRTSLASFNLGIDVNEMDNNRGKRHSMPMHNADGKQGFP